MPRDSGTLTVGWDSRFQARIYVSLRRLTVRVFWKPVVLPLMSPYNPEVDMILTGMSRGDQ